MKALKHAIIRGWRAYKVRALEIELDSINRLLDETAGGHEAMLAHRREIQRELSHARGMWLLTLKPGDRRTFEVA